MTFLKTHKLTRRQTLAGLGAGVSVLALPGCVRTIANSADASVTGAGGLLDDIAYNLLKLQPEGATSLGVDTGQYGYLRSRLTDTSMAGRRALVSTLQSDLARARNADKTTLDAATRTSFEVVESAYSTALDGLALPYGDVAVGGWRNAPYVVIQNVGAYIDLPRFLSSTHPLRDADDAQAYIARLEAVPEMLAGELERMKSATDMGVVPPDFLLVKAIGQMRSTLQDAMTGGAWVQPLADNAGTLGTDATLQASAREIVTRRIAPALEAQLAELYRQQKSATSQPGMWARRHGDEFYAWALRASTTTRMMPDEVHERGLEELAMLHGRMDPILRQLGYTSGSVGSRMTALGGDPRFKFAEGDAGRAEIMTFIKGRIDWIKAQMPRAFNTLVDPNLEVTRIPLAEEVGAPGAYGGAGSKDGLIPGRMWINLRTTDLHRKYDLADLTYHEAIPGHVWEGEYSNTLPLIRSILKFNAFSEGWALYGEQLADELGAYDDYAVGKLGYLQSLAFRACRMVVDTGLHSKRWGRQQAVDFFVQRNGSKVEEVASEVDRYCSWPGQACGYKVGHSEIVRQRALAQSAMGSAYDFKAFNDAVVLGGNAPLDVLAKNVARYIETA